MSDTNNQLQLQGDNINIDSNVNLETSEQKQTEPEGKSITDYVKAEVVNQLIEMGFSKNVSEKACFFNQNVLENAINWIYEHQNDPDFEEELRIVGEENKPKMTDEEIKQKAKELQELARKRYLQKQKDLEEEQERNRIRTSNLKLKLKII